MSTDFTDHGQGSGTGVDEDPPVPMAAEPDAPVTGAPVTGDPEIDGVLEELAVAQDRPLAERIAAGEQAHAAFQARLRDLGGA